jgi:glycosyltransferase involved in cell wall biosynthesis
MRKLKIIQTPIRFYPYIGGVEKYVLDLSKELVKNGNDVKVVCANEPNSDIKSIEGINILRLNYYGKIANTNLCWGLFSRLLKEDFDVIHTHMPTPWSADISALVSLIKNKPLVITYHNDLIKTGFASIITGIYNNTFLKLLLKRADKIIITQRRYIDYSKYLKKYKDKIVVLPNAIDLNIFKKINIKKEKNSLFFLSVLDEFHRYKGLDYLLKAIGESKKKIPTIKLYIAGKGKLLEEYKKLAEKLKIEENVEFLSYVSDEDLIKYYNKSEIFILPSIDHNEGFGIVLLEALACETPVITTDIVGIANEIKEKKCGVVIEPKNSLTLSKSILGLLNDDKKRIDMGNNGSKLVKERYNWKDIAKNIENLYKEVLKK